MRRRVNRILHAAESNAAIADAYDIVFAMLRRYEAAVLSGDTDTAQSLLGEIEAKLPLAVDIQRMMAH